MLYFELYQLPVRVITDRAQLNRQYIAQQKAAHPDFYSLSDEAAQEAALERSALLNEARTVLLDEDAALQYILKEKGLISDQEKQVLPPEFLMEVMELNELEETERIAEATRLTDALRQDFLPLLLQEWDAETTSQELLPLKDYYFRKKYLQRILDRKQQ